MAGINVSGCVLILSSLLVNMAQGKFAIRHSESFSVLKATKRRKRYSLAASSAYDMQYSYTVKVFNI